MEIHIKIASILLIILSLIHIIFPRYFNWNNDLKSLSLINQQMMKVHTFFIALTVLLMGLFCLTSSSALMETPLGKKIALGFGIFWTVRLFFHFFVYTPELWKGKKFETSMHILFSIFWIYLSLVFILTYYK